MPVHLGKCRNCREQLSARKDCYAYGMLIAGIGSKEYLHGPMDAAIKSKFNCSAGGINVHERRK